MGRIPIYHTSREWQVQRDGTLLVQYPPAELARIRRGQTARLTLTPAEGGDVQPQSAKVLEVANRQLNRLEPDTVRLSVSGAPPKVGQTGAVEVLVEQISPATALARAFNQSRLPKR